MHEIKITCPSCKVEHAWTSVDINDTICIRAMCEFCFSPLQIVIHPGFCFSRPCNIACSGTLSRQKIFRVVDFECRERTLLTLGEIVDRMTTEPAMARLFEELAKE
jgi:hypothetical protein